jgi:biotin transport system substrate-specific component
LSTRDIAYIALFAAIMAVLGLVPKIDTGILPVPITAQLTGVMLAGSVLGASRAALSQILFLALVAAGLPLLSGGRGGLGVFFGPSAGFLLAWPVMAFVIGWLTEKYWHRLTFIRLFLIHFLGSLLIIFPPGILVISLVTGVSLQTAAVGSVVFLPGDIVKAVLATAVALFVKRGYPLIHARSA